MLYVVCGIVCSGLLYSLLVGVGSFVLQRMANDLTTASSKLPAGAPTEDVAGGHTASEPRPQCGRVSPVAAQHEAPNSDLLEVIELLGILQADVATNYKN